MGTSKGKKTGIGKGTGKKGWDRWQVGAKRAKGVKPYKSKGVNYPSDNKGDKTEV